MATIAEHETAQVAEPAIAFARKHAAPWAPAPGAARELPPMCRRARAGTIAACSLRHHAAVAR